MVMGKCGTPTSCWQWQGTITASEEASPGITSSTTANVTFQAARASDGLPNQFGLDAKYTATAGTVSRELSGSKGGGTYSGDDFALLPDASSDHLSSYNGTLPGPWYRGYRGQSDAMAFTCHVEWTMARLPTRSIIVRELTLDAPISRC